MSGAKVQRCRICGCTDDNCSQCVEKTGEPCFWVEADLCSACRHVMTRAIMDKLQCATPGCTEKHDGELVLNSGCHAGFPTFASYDANTGVLTIRCAWRQGSGRRMQRCDQVVAEILVARGPDA